MESRLINLFPITKVITWIASLYALSVSSLALALNASGVAALGIAFKGMAALNFVLLVIAALGWRYLWRWVPKLGTWIYPDLNGKWVVDINWHWGDTSGRKKAKAQIKQTLLKISIELQSNESESVTLLVVPHKDVNSSRPGLYYLYRNEPSRGAAQTQKSHLGAALLKVDPDTNQRLRGNYFTDRSTNGQFTFRRESGDI